MANNPDHQENLKPFKPGDQPRKGKFIVDGEAITARWVVKCTPSEFDQLEKLRKNIAEGTKKKRLSRRAFLLSYASEDIAALETQ